MQAQALLVASRAPVGTSDGKEGKMPACATGAAATRSSSAHSSAHGSAAVARLLLLRGRIIVVTGVGLMVITVVSW